MGLSRHLDSGGIAHANADSQTHARHVRQRSAQRALSWLPEAVEDNPAQEFRLKTDGLNLGQGAYWTGFGDAESSVSGQVFQDHCNAINWARAF